MAKIAIDGTRGTYPVVCSRGAVSRVSDLAREQSRRGEIFFLSSPRVWNYWGRKLTAKSRGQRSATILFDDSELAKRLATVEKIARALVSLGADRDATLVAVGGGVVGDVAGFVAASYLRGVRLIHVPTTLVAQVDSAIGGKTGVNLPEGKNLVGAFYPPKLVLVDPELLETLPEREFRSGLAEVIKYGVIADARLFAFLEKNFAKILARDQKTLEHVIVRSVQIKARVVSADERETGLREILNFGHTFGHALESVTQYRRYLHGEAVAWGMMAAALYGHEIGVTPAADASRIISLVRRMEKLPDWPRVAPKKLI